MIPRNVPGTGSAYLGVACQAVRNGRRSGESRAVSGAELRAGRQGSTVERVGDRQQLLTRLRHAAARSRSPRAIRRDRSFSANRRWDILSVDGRANAFDLDAEPQSVRERYGFMPAYVAPTPDRCGVPGVEPAHAARAALGRSGRAAGDGRLPLVGHARERLRIAARRLPAALGQAYTALIEDLEAARPARIDDGRRLGRIRPHAAREPTGGRDHYPNVFSAALAGGGVQGGRVVGESDAKGALPPKTPKRRKTCSPPSIATSASNPAEQYLDNNGRPHRRAAVW